MASHCPYLGLMSDPKTTTMYPTSDNACHRASPPASIALHYQSSCCLDKTYEKCPGFIVGWPDGFPKKLRGQKPPAKQKKLIPYWMIFIGVGLLVLIMVIGALSQISGAENQPITINKVSVATQTLTNLSVQNATPTLAATHTKTIEPSPTQTNTPTLPATQTPGPELQTPFGSSGFTFAVHEVLAGQTMAIIADLYDTNPEVIEAINQLSPPERTTLWEGDNLVVCVNCENWDTLPKLQAIYIESDVTTEDLAETYNTSVEDIRQWNDLGENDGIESPRWVIVRADQ